MRMQMQALDAFEKPDLVERSVNFDRSGQSVRCHRRMQAEPVVDRHAEPGEQRPCEPAEALLRRYSPVAMVEVLCGAAREQRFTRKRLRFADVVVRGRRLRRGRVHRGICEPPLFRKRMRFGRCGANLS